MNTIEANFVDIKSQTIFPARVFFDTHIRKIEPLVDVTFNSFILPGFVDAHVHIESSMLPPSEFARLAVQHGTLAAVCDPHEITNVLGVDGINFMLENSKRFPFRFIFGAPSCVPATPLETSGASITDDDIDQLFKSGKVIYLSEMMNFPGVVHRDSCVMAKIAVAQKYGKPIDGHAPGLTGESLYKYVEAGISTDHECITLEEAEEKIRYGMKILIREGSAAKNFDVLCPLIEKYPEKIMLCTDDFHPDDLLRGHINSMLSKGVANGLDLFKLLRAATQNPIKHYHIDLGLLQLDDSADFVVVDNLKNFTIQQSYFRGVCVFDRAGEEINGKLRNYKFHRTQPATTTAPNRFGASTIDVSDIQVIASSDKMKVMQTFDGSLFTKQLIHDVQKGSLVIPNLETDILKIVVLNRYHPAKPAVGFIRGFGLKHGALVSTVAHDSHHIVAVGCDDHSIVTVINHITNIKGGLAAYFDGQLIDLNLNIAGLMSSAPAEEVAKKYEELNKVASQMGCILTSPFMTLSFMSLLVIPELKLGEKGLFDVGQFGWTEVFL